MNNLSRIKVTANNPRMISIMSGKGGVGKSVLSFNLAERMSALGLKVLLADADFSSGNIHILANINCDYGIGHLISGQRSLKETVTSVNANIDILASTWQNEDIDTTDVNSSAELIASLRSQAQSYDIVLIDHSSGISKAATIIANGCDLSVLVIVPELTSICDGYGLFKRLNEVNDRIDCRLLINRVSEAGEQDYIFNKFAAMTERFVGRVPTLLGSLAENDIYRESVASQCAIATIKIDSPVVQQLTGICQTLATDHMQAVNRLSMLSNKEINNKTATADIKG